MGIDLMSISAHKIYGPKGIGACYVRRRPRVRLEPIMSGGGQERGLRSGTVAAPLVVGFGEACRLAKKEMAVSFVRFLYPSKSATNAQRISDDESFPRRCGLGPSACVFSGGGGRARAPSLSHCDGPQAYSLFRPLDDPVQGF